MFTFREKGSNEGEIKLKCSHEILFDSKVCGFYGMNDENRFEIWLYLEYETREGYRPVRLSQTTPTESKCRCWLLENADKIRTPLIKLHLIP